MADTERPATVVIKREDGITEDSIAKTAAGVPNVVLKVLTPLEAVVVRGARLYLQTFLGLATALQTGLAHKLGVDLNTHDLWSVLAKSAGLAVAPLVFNVLQNILELVTRLDEKMPQLRAAVLLPLALTLTLSGAACHAPVSVQTPQGQTAYTADQIVVRVNELQNVAIQAEATGGLPTATARTIVQFCLSADRVLKTTPQGWQTTVGQAWAETKRQLPPISNATVIAAIQSVDAVLAALGS